MESDKSARDRLKKNKRASCPNSKVIGIRYYGNAYSVDFNTGLATFAEFSTKKNQRLKLSFKFPEHLERYKA